MVESLAGYRNAVFSAFQLALQLQEILVGFQVGVTFGDDHQASQSLGQFALGGLELLEGGRSELGGIDGDLGGFGARFHDVGEGLLFEVGVSLDRGN